MLARTDCGSDFLGIGTNHLSALLKLGMELREWKKLDEPVQFGVAKDGPRAMHTATHTFRLNYAIETPAGLVHLRDRLCHFVNNQVPFFLISNPCLRSIGINVDDLVTGIARWHRKTGLPASSAPLKFIPVDPSEANVGHNNDNGTPNSSRGQPTRGNRKRDERLRGDHQALRRQQCRHRRRRSRHDYNLAFSIIISLSPPPSPFSSPCPVISPSPTSSPSPPFPPRSRSPRGRDHGTSRSRDHTPAAGSRRSPMRRR